MAETTDRLSAQKTRYLAEIRDLEEKLSRLKTKVEVIDDIRRDSKQPSVDVSHNGANHGKRTGLTKFALEAVKSLNEGTIGNIAEFVKSKGYLPKGNFKTSLATTLDRLNSKKIRIEEKDGAKIYNPI